jgi:ABC-type multidrug transport system ATPase subunit
VVLTTHNLEEAQALCDRLGIFVDGALVCVGNPREVTARHGGFLVFTLAVPAGREADAKALVERAVCRDARLTYSVGGTLRFELPAGSVALSAVFRAMAAAKVAADPPVLDWGVANATLEEVFIRFARQIGAEAGD